MRWELIVKWMHGKASFWVLSWLSEEKNPITIHSQQYLTHAEREIAAYISEKPPYFLSAKTRPSVKAEGKVIHKINITQELEVKKTSRWTSSNISCTCLKLKLLLVHMFS